MLRKGFFCRLFLFFFFGNFQRKDFLFHFFLIISVLGVSYQPIVLRLYFKNSQGEAFLVWSNFVLSFDLTYYRHVKDVRNGCSRLSLSVFKNSQGKIYFSFEFSSLDIYCYYLYRVTNKIVDKEPFSNISQGRYDVMSRRWRKTFSFVY